MSTFSSLIIITVIVVIELCSIAMILLCHVNDIMFRLHLSYHDDYHLLMDTWHM